MYGPLPSRLEKAGGKGKVAILPEALGFCEGRCMFMITSSRLISQRRNFGHLEAWGGLGDFRPVREGIP